jgi:protein-disulfide isomerase
MSKKGRDANRSARAAAIQKEQAARERNRKTAIVVAVLLVLGVIVAAGVLLSGGDKGDTSSGATPQASAVGQALVVGNEPAAKVKAVVYEDFLCPYCRELELATRDFLRADAAKGKALVEYRPFQLLPDQYSTLALTAWGAVLQKGTAQQALAFHDILFDKQPNESAPDKPDVDQLVAWAKQAGVKDRSVLDAIGKPNPAFVEAADKAATAAGVQGTPTVIVNGKTLQGSPSDMADQLKALIEG